MADWGKRGRELSKRGWLDKARAGDVRIVELDLGRGADKVAQGFRSRAEGIRPERVKGQRQRDEQKLVGIAGAVTSHRGSTECQKREGTRSSDGCIWGAGRGEPQVEFPKVR